MKHVLNESDVVCIRTDAPVRKAAETMKARGIGSLVVVDEEGHLAGIVTDRDLCLRAVRWNRDPDATTVESVMSKGVRTLPTESTRDEQAQLMRRMGVRRVPLVDSEGRPVGLVSVDDWIRWIAARLHELAATADPALRHGPLRGPEELLDDLEAHLERQEAEHEEYPLRTRTVIDRDELLEAIARLRRGMTGET